MLAFLPLPDDSLGTQGPPGGPPIWLGHPHGAPCMGGGASPWGALECCGGTTQGDSLGHPGTHGGGASAFVWGLGDPLKSDKMLAFLPPSRFPSGEPRMGQVGGGIAPPPSPLSLFT